MEINRRALYNSLRMNWVLDPTLQVESWQVEDYRSQPIDSLFEGLENHDIHLDKVSFKALAENADTPENLTDTLLAEIDESIPAQDQIYLLIFELWRRLLPEKNCLSIFCDEIDYQIHLFDQQEIKNEEAIEDALSNLLVLLDENVDDGIDAEDAFECIESGCANDIESFLYDFIGEQIDHSNNPYAQELLDGFSNYVQDTEWFDFLRARLLTNTDPEEAKLMIKELVNNKKVSSNLELNLEILSFLVSHGDQPTFEKLAKNTLKLLQLEEDFQILVSICADFYLRLDREDIEKPLQALLAKRETLNPEKPFNSNDSQVKEFSKIISL